MKKKNDSKKSEKNKKMAARFLKYWCVLNTYFYYGLNENFKSMLAKWFELDDSNAKIKQEIMAGKYLWNARTDFHLEKWRETRRDYINKLRYRHCYVDGEKFVKFGLNVTTKTSGDFIKTSISII